MSSSSNPSTNQSERLSLKDIIVILLGITIPIIVKGIFDEYYVVPLILTGVILVIAAYILIKSPRIRLCPVPLRG
jgi:hypothetical protein